jgi:hypothetical protein
MRRRNARAEDEKRKKSSNAEPHGGKGEAKTKAQGAEMVRR